MRAQLSLELLLYVALAGLSFAFAVAAVSKAWTGLGENASLFELTQFADSINAALLSNGSFSVNTYLPPGLCGSTADGNMLDTKYGAVYFVYGVNATQQTFCPDGTYVALSILVKNGVAYFSRG